MLKNLFLFTFLSVFMFSCIDDDEVDTLYVDEDITVTTNTLELDYGTSKTFSTGEELRKWYLGDEYIFESIRYTFNPTKAGKYTISSVLHEENKTDSIVYNIHVFGQFAEGVVVVNGSSEDMSHGTLAFIQNDQTVIDNAFEKVNLTNLSDGLISAATQKNHVYVVSQNGPNYIAQLNRETLELEDVIDHSDASSPAYLNFYNDQAVLVNADSDDRSAYFWNPGVNSIYTAALDSLDNVPAIQSFALQVADELLIASGKDVYRYKDETATKFYTSDGFISGILPDDRNGFYIATQKTDNEAAQFVHYNAQFDAIQTINIPDEYRMPRNGNIIAVGDNFYWQETSLGTLIKYDAYNNKYTDLGYPYSYGIYFTTVIKENPFTGDIFIGGLSDFSTSEGVVAQLNSNGELIKTYENIGYTPVDFIFNDKSLFR